MAKMNYKKFLSIFLFETVGCILACIILVAYIDPFMHYHKPNPAYFYKLDGGRERFVNDGIFRHFEYDALITGTSMTENFKTTESDKIFQADFIKVPFSGATYNEQCKAIETAYRNGHNLKYVIRSLDWDVHLVESKDAWRNDLGTYPTYLYNENYLDDIAYFMNRTALSYSTRMIKNRIKGQQGGMTSFDEYANWNADYTFGKEILSGKYKEEQLKHKAKINFSNKDAEMLKENLEQNVIALAKEHPGTTFYCFFPPYSIAYWRLLYENGELEYTLKAEKLAIEMLLEYPNIKLYSFNLNNMLVTNLANYKDLTHYGEWINSQILLWIKNGDGLLTKDNYKEYLKKEKAFYSHYDYASIF